MKKGVSKGSRKKSSFFSGPATKRGGGGANKLEGEGLSGRTIKK